MKNGDILDRQPVQYIDIAAAFASPPSGGFGSTTPRPVSATTLTASGAFVGASEARANSAATGRGWFATIATSLQKAFSTYVSGDAANRWEVRGNGDMWWGDGTTLDVAFGRSASGVGTFTGRTVHPSGYTTAPVLVSALPAASGLSGTRRFVSDSNAAMTAGIGAVVAGGGSNVVPVYSDGTNWRIG